MQSERVQIDKRISKCSSDTTDRAESTDRSVGWKMQSEPISEVKVGQLGKALWAMNEVQVGSYNKRSELWAVPEVCSVLHLNPKRRVLKCTSDQYPTCSLAVQTLRRTTQNLFRVFIFSFLSGLSFYTFTPTNFYIYVGF